MSGLRAASAPVTAQLTVPTYNATGALLVARSRGPRQQMRRVTAGAVVRDVEGVDGQWTHIPGLKYLPWDICGFIDDTMYVGCAPFSGPRGDYAGAARKEVYDEAQRALYTGYKKFHGLKLQTVLIPNGLSFVFGCVSCRRSDAGVLRMSGLNDFLVFIQQGLFMLATGVPIIYALFGDTAFNIGALACFMSYFRAFGAEAQLTQWERMCNGAIKGARNTIEKN